MRLRAWRAPGMAGRAWALLHKLVATCPAAQLGYPSGMRCAEASRVCRLHLLPSKEGKEVVFVVVTAHCFHSLHGTRHMRACTRHTLAHCTEQCIKHPLQPSSSDMCAERSHARCCHCKAWQASCECWHSE